MDSFNGWIQVSLENGELTVRVRLSYAYAVEEPSLYIRSHKRIRRLICLDYVPRILASVLTFTQAQHLVDLVLSWLNKQIKELTILYEKMERIN